MSKRALWPVGMLACGAAAGRPPALLAVVEVR
jgi:hypothetical protein